MARNMLVEGEMGEDGNVNITDGVVSKLGENWRENYSIVETVPISTEEDGTWMVRVTVKNRGEDNNG